MKNRIFKCSVKNKTSKIYFLVHDKISFIGAPAKGTPVAHGGRSCSLVLYRSPPYTIGQTGSDRGRQTYRQREGGRANLKGERRDAGSQTDTEMKRERYTVLQT